jgi:hypothetical protein
MVDSWIRAGKRVIAPDLGGLQRPAVKVSLTNERKERIGWTIVDFGATDGLLRRDW